MTADIPEQLATYFQQRAAARASAVNEVLDGLTERERGLVHDAAVMGYVQGLMRPREEGCPKDSQVVAGVIHACLSHPDLYPTLTGYVPIPLCAVCGRAEDEHEIGDEHRHGFAMADEEPQP